MQCPAEVAAVLHEILQAGLLQCRAAAWAGDAARCAVEADHLHNLPDLLRDYTPERMAYYREVERAGYEDASTAAQAQVFRPLWERLRRQAEQLSPT